jgi:hypothetical protein
MVVRYSGNYRNTGYGMLEDGGRARRCGFVFKSVPGRERMSGCL